MKDYYVYIIFRPNGIPCYVGQGKGDRWRRHARGSHNPHLNNIYKKYHDLPIVKVREGLTKEEAVETEIAFISVIGREINGGPLVNMTDGGEGTAGYSASPEWREHRSLMAKKVWSDPEYKEKQRERKLGNQISKKPHTLSPEWRECLSEKMKGNSNTKGMVHTDEAKQKMRDRWKDAEWREKMMESRRAAGTYSKETLAKRSATRVANNLAKK